VGGALGVAGGAWKPAYEPLHGAHAAEELTRVNEANRTSGSLRKRYLPVASTKKGVEFWRISRKLCVRVSSGRQDGGEIGLLHRVYYKFVGLVRVDDKCLSSIFLRAKNNCKLVYYGPGLGGKTATCSGFMTIPGKTKKGEMVSLATGDRPDTLPSTSCPRLGPFAGSRRAFILYTVPGQVFYEASRKLILRARTAWHSWRISQEERLDANFETMENLQNT